MTLGQQLSYFRKQGHYSRPDISASTGIDVSTLQNIENGITLTPKKTTTKILQDYMDSVILSNDSMIQLALDGLIQSSGSIKNASEIIGCSNRSIYRWMKGTIPHPAVRKLILGFCQKTVTPK